MECSHIMCYCANEFDVFFRDTGNALEIIGGLPSSYFHRFPGYEDSFVMSAGILSADENVAWVKSGVYSRELLTEVIGIFQSKSLEFVWPVFPDSSAQMASDMEELGLLPRETFSAMIFDSDTDCSLSTGGTDLKYSVKRALTSEEAILWAHTCWGGFTREEEVSSPEFIKFARNAVLNDRLRLHLGYVDNKPVGAYMLCMCGGIYISHFSVLPDFRGLGIGSLFMNEIMDYNVSVNNRFLVLLSTKSGKRLYEKCGFRSVADVTIRSFSEEI